MHIRQAISVGNLLLDTGNYRIVKQTSQKEARDAIIAEQGKKLANLAKDIIDHGLNPFDLPLVIDAADGQQNFIVIEGNRRLTAISLLLKPELAEGTLIHAAFKKLNRDHADAIPKVLDCVIAPNREAGLLWINRKHASGLEGIGTEPWSAMAKARADLDQGIARPDLDAVNFVLSGAGLDQKLRLFLEGSQFNLTSLKRLVETKAVQQAAGFLMHDSKLVSDQPKERIQAILTEVVTIIANGIHKGEKFTERNIDSQEKRADFIAEIVAKHPKKGKAGQPWVIAGKSGTVALKAKVTKTKVTPSTGEQPNLIPKSFKLALPSGKINDIFVELKQMDAVKHRHAISVLFRVFFELSLDDYIQKHSIQLPKDGKGRFVDKMTVRLGHVTTHVKTTKLLSEKELKPIEVAIGDNDSLLAPDTLNAYVHSPWMNPDPMQLKLSWANCQLFIERLWSSQK